MFESEWYKINVKRKPVIDLGDDLNCIYDWLKYDGSDFRGKFEKPVFHLAADDSDTEIDLNILDDVSGYAPWITFNFRSIASLKKFIKQLDESVVAFEKQIEEYNE